MKLSQRFFNFYLNSSIHVSLSVVSLCVITALHFGLDLERDFLLFIFFGSITAYNFVKFAGIAGLHHLSLARNLRVIQVFSLVSFLVLFFLALRISTKVLAGSAVLGIFTLLYAVPVFSRRRNLRALAGIKVLVIALVWAGVTVLLPLLNENTDISFSVSIEFLQRFIFVLVLMLPFEIRDLRYDRSDLRTIPQRKGIQGAKRMGYVLLVLWALLEVFKHTSSPVSLVSIAATALVTGILLYRTKEIQSPYFASFWVEAVPVLWLLILILLKSFT